MGKQTELPGMVRTYTEAIGFLVAAVVFGGGVFAALIMLIAWTVALVFGK
jgi:hypothetical protein